MFVVVFAQPRNGGTWAMQCVEDIIQRPMLFEPFEGIGVHGDSTMGAPLPPHLVAMGSSLSEHMKRFADRPAPEQVEQRFDGFVAAYLEHRTDTGGVKITRNLPSTVRALGLLSDVVVLRVMRNLPDAAVSSLQRWRDDTWIHQRIRATRQQWPDEAWDVVDRLSGDEYLYASRLLSMWCSRRMLTAWLREQDGFRWHDVSMERLAVSPTYAAPQVADLLGADPEVTRAVFTRAKAPVHSNPVLRPAAELRRYDEIADMLGVPRI